MTRETQAPAALSPRLAPNQSEAIDRAIERFQAHPETFHFGAEEATLARDLVALPVTHKAGRDLFLLRRDGEVLLHEKGSSHGMALELRIQLRHMTWTSAANLHPDLQFLAPARPGSAEDCKACKGKGVATRKSSWTIDLGSHGQLCGDCVGRGWKRAPLMEHDNVLSALWGTCLQSAEFREQFKSEPRKTLEEHGLGTAETVGIEVLDRVALKDNPALSDPRYLCQNCQLSTACIGINMDFCSCESRSSSPSPLQLLLEACRDEAFLGRFKQHKYAVLYERQLDMPDNVIVRIWDTHPPQRDPSSYTCASCQQMTASIMFILGLCTCDEPELADLIDWG